MLGVKSRISNRKKKAQLFSVTPNNLLASMATMELFKVDPSPFGICR